MYKDTHKNEEENLKRISETSIYWTPELIEWIGTETDPIRLACTAHLLNCGTWPQWLPSKPEQYKERSYRDPLLFFCVDLMRTIEQKSEAICPGLSDKIWVTGYFKKYGESNE